MSSWERHAFTMIAPDAIRRGLTGRILDYFARAGLEPCRWAVGEITAPQVDAMHGDTVARSDQAYRYRCLDLLFALEPCLMVALHDRGDPPGNIHARALAVRGASTAQDIQAGSIRHDLRAYNRVMSLLHVSDTAAHAAVESAVLVAEARPGGLGRAGGGWRPAAELPTYLALLSRRTADPRDLVAVRRNLRIAVLTRVWSSLDGKARDSALEWVDGSPPAGVDSHAAGAALARSHPAAAILPLTFEEPVDLTEVKRRLETIGLGLDDWARTIVTTSMYFPPW